MADLIYTVDYSDVKQADNALKGLGNTSTTTASKSARAYIPLNAEFRKNLNLTRQKIAFDQRMQRQQERLTSSTMANAAAQRSFNNATQMATKGMSRQGVVTQQVGYQVGDFLVQVQSGTNAMVAFGQQATQLAGLIQGRFVMLGAALGIAIPLITAIGAAIMRTRQEAEAAENGVAKFSESIKTLKEETRDTVLELEALRTGMRSVAELGVQQEITRLREQERNILSEMESLSGRNLRAAELRLQATRATITELEQQINKSREVADALERARDMGISLKDVAAAINFDGAIAGADKLFLKLKAAAGEAYSILAATAAEAQARKSIEDGTFELGLGAAAYGGAQESMRNQMEAANTQSGFFAPSSGGGSGGGSSGGGGGGGSSAPLSISGLAQSLLNEQEQIDMWYEESLEKLSDFNSKELELLGGHNEAKARLEEEYTSRVQELKKAERDAIFGGYQGMFSDVASLMQTENKKLFKIGQAAAIAEATISGYRAAVEAWEWGMGIGGPPLAAAASAASLIKTGALISNIASQSPSGGSSSGGSGGGGAGAGGGGAIATPEASPGPQRILIEGLSPTDMLSGEMLQELFDKFYDENEERGAVFVVST